MREQLNDLEGDGIPRGGKECRGVDPLRRAVSGAAVAERPCAVVPEDARGEWLPIFQAIGHPSVILDPEHRILQANEAVCRHVGKSAAELTGMRCYQVFHDAALDRPPAGCPLQRIIDSRAIETAEMPMEILQGDYIVSCTPVLDASGGLTRIIHIATDITQRKRAEQKLVEERAFLRQVIDAVPGFISVKDAVGRFQLVNRSLATACGASADELIGRQTTDFNFDAEGFERTQRDNGEVMANGKEKFIDGEPFTFADQTVHWVSKYKAPLFDPDGGCRRVLTVGTDITYRRAAEEENQKLQRKLIQIQKMEAIGTMAGGIAHDFNNILMGLQGHISMFLYDLAPDHPHRLKFENMESYVRRGAELTKQLLGFARGGKYDVKPTAMNDLLAKSADLFGRTRKEITIYKRFAEDLWNVEVDQGQMDQVFLNLFINASQAMPGGGNLDLATENVEFCEADVKLVGITAGRYVRISVTDDGIGMDAKTLERVFDPFFTTKPKGIGTGLGLSSAYGIVKNHGGGIHVYSEPGKGTTVKVYLPAKAARPAASEKRWEKVLTGTETILVVDDEQINVAVMRDMLEMLHYRVIAAGSGQEAVAAYLAKQGEIDLVILDMIMPGIGGGRTFDILKENNPEVAVILASGYSAEGEAAAILKRGCRGFIQKPFQLQELSRTIRQVLDGKPGR